MTPKRPPFSRWLHSSNDITQQFLAIGGQPDIVSLAGGLPAAELYPVEAVRESADRALRRWGSDALEYGPVEGLPALREAIAKKYQYETGGAIEAKNVLITSGSMQGLDLIGKVLIDPQDQVVVQFPTYLGALDAWRPREPRYSKLDWMAEPDHLCESLRVAKFAYAVPNYSNPTGHLVPLARRKKLLAAVRESGIWLVEDDPYAPLRLDGDHTPSMLALDTANQHSADYLGPVIYLGTLSKSIVPGLRVGWIIAEEAMIRALTLAKMSTDLSGCMFTQATALDLLECGVDRTHAAAMLPHYRERRDALCAAAARHLHEWFDWEIPPGGMFVWMRAKRADLDTDVLYRYALQEKVAFIPSSVFDFDGHLRDCMRLNFTRAGPGTLADGIERLARAVRRFVLDREGKGLSHR